MCGIAGAFFSNRAEPVETMIDCLAHRGPDGRGVKVLGEAVLGHARLAIVGLGSGGQPMGRGGHWIAYNGEVYNYQELAAVELSGRKLAGISDTEVILELYRRYGPDCVERLDGMFAFAIVHGGELFLARDPLGIKPLYFGKRAGVLYFSSEIKVLQVQCDEVREFPPGTWFHSGLGWRRYYRLADWIESCRTAEDRAMADYAAILDRAVRKRLIAEVPVGVSLSGGLDSSVVAALAARAHGGIETFAAGMPGSGDLAAAKLVADHLGTRHREAVYTEAEILDCLPRVLYHLESFDPALVRSAVANFFLARLAAESVKVILTGEGADELFAGYDYMSEFSDAGELGRETVAVTEALHNTNLQRTDRITMAFGLEARVPFLDKESTAFALGLPPEWKLHRGRAPKHFLRRAFAGLLPQAILDRPKLKFSQGAGSSDLVAAFAESEVSDRDFNRERDRMLRAWQYDLPNKEALFYYRMLSEYMDDAWIFPHMGRSRSL